MKHNHFHHWHKIALLLCGCDFLCIGVAYLLGLWLRFDCDFAEIPSCYFNPWLRYIPYHALLSILLYQLLGLYNRIWGFVGYRELLRCIVAGLLGGLLHYVSVQLIMDVPMPTSYYLIGGVLQMIALVGIRFSRRFVRLVVDRSLRKKPGIRESAMLIGAGSAGQIILRDLSTTRVRNISFKCIIDDDDRKWGCRIEDVPVVGGREDIKAAVERFKIQKIFVAIPTASARQRQEILSICKETGCQVKILPGIYQFTDDEVSLSKMRDVSVDDLLGRESIEVDEHEIARSVVGKTILITGGSGSIGGELCRQIAKYSPLRLVVVDINENSAYFLREELIRDFPNVDVQVHLGSVRDSRRIEAIFDKYRPQIVFHAAGHKQLSFMEASPCEAVKNNVIGAYKSAYIAMSYGCEKFVLLSSDKAVNPTSIFGASCRLCEMLMQTMEYLSRSNQLQKLFLPYSHEHHQKLLPSECHTEFAAIRFGNVMGSDGAELQIFQKQIASGGPVKVADPKMTRFCMSLQDTVQLLLLASTYAKDGEVFVLDMGEPYNMDELARRLIKLCGMVPDEDIRIEYTGLRDGEKLYEEPLMWEEGMRKTACSRIYVANPTRIDFDAFLLNLREFFEAVNENCNDVQSRMSKVCNSYRAPDAGGGAFSIARMAKRQESINNLERIASMFAIDGEVTAAIPMNKGYINRTYRIETRTEDGRFHQYTLQRINTNVFPDPSALMDNFVNVTRHLESRFRLPARPDLPANQTVIFTKDGNSFFSDESGAWRMLTYIGHVHSYDIPENPQVFYHSGVAFGAFLKAMSDYPAYRIHEVIPNFHDTARRFEDLEKSIAADPVGRVSQTLPEIDFLRKHAWLFSIISDALRKGEIPTRLGHNDCNLNNVLFDDSSNEPVAVIDLDTVMPSTPLYDFGDSMRIGTNTAKDDEKDLTKVQCDLNLYREYARGWLEQCGDMLTPKEKELLPYAALVITAEDGIRFLMDHIDGDKYYYIYYQGQNLDRARTQLHLLADMETKLPQIKTILNSQFSILNLN